MYVFESKYNDFIKFVRLTICLLQCHAKAIERLQWGISLFKKIIAQYKN